MKRLILPIGISGSGKSTYIRRNFKPEVVINPDTIRKELTGDIGNHTMETKLWGEIVPQRIHIALEKYGEAVLDATNVDSGLRGKFLKQFGSDVKKIALIFNVDPDITKNRIKTDLQNKVDRSPVPDYAVDRQYEKFKNGLQNIKIQFDEIQYVSNDITEAYKVGETVWILTDNNTPYDLGKVVSFDGNSDFYIVKASTKGNIFKVQSKNLRPHSLLEVKLLKLRKLIRNEIKKSMDNIQV